MKIDPAAVGETAPYRAIVIGATGAVGSSLVRELLASPRCLAATALVRRSTDMFAGAPGAAKLTLRVIEMVNLETATLDAARGCAVAFCTMGVGQPRKVPKAEVWKIDVEYPAAFARACRAAGVGHISLLASVGADARSRSSYLRLKGSAEEGLREQRFPRTSFFRPSLLVTQEIRYGLQDRLTQAIFPRLSLMLPRRFHEITVEDLARAMRINAEQPPAAGASGSGDSADGVIVEVLHYGDFVKLLAS